MNFIICTVVGLVCGLLSGMGIGGGTFLLLYMTGIAGVSQSIAQGTNLIYFIPTSAASLISHIKNKYVSKQAFFSCSIPGVFFSVASALVATSIDVEILRKFFGAFLVFTGLKMFFVKSKN